MYPGHGAAPSSNSRAVTLGAEPHAGCVTLSLQVPVQAPQALAPHA